MLIGDSPLDFDSRAGLNIMLETERYSSWTPPEWILRVRSLINVPVFF